MTTQNIAITKRGWQNLATVGSIDFVENKKYTVSARGSGVCELALSSTKPNNDFLGHIANADENFTFEYIDEALWVKCGEDAVIVIS